MLSEERTNKGKNELFRDNQARLLPSSKRILQRNVSVQRGTKIYIYESHFNPILDGGGANLPPSWFFEYSSETVRSRKLKLCDF